MAKEDEDKDNPFSFKKFVKERNKSGNKKPKKKISVSEPKGGSSALFPEVEVSGSDKLEDQNPYSFKKFLKNKTTVTPPTIHKRLSQSESDTSFSSGDDIETEHFQEEKLSSSKIMYVTQAPLLTDPQNGSTSSSSSDEDTPLKHEDGESDDRILDPFPAVLPDHGRLEWENEKLKEENEKLKQKVRKYQTSLQEEKHKNKSLTNEVKTLKKKEQSETKALEQMILKVEENLITANKRAVVAESTIVKLKQEIQKLQGELAASNNPQAIRQGYEELILGVREKANFASQQLVSASHRADLQIRELCQGIETLKLVAEVLINIDNSFEVKK